jgi:very-short-patch-repair endonuclease
MPHYSAADQACAAMANRQDGAFTTIQCLAAGHSEKSLRCRVETGRYRRELPGVLSIAGSPRTWRTASRAAQYWAGPGSALSHRCAARWWSFDGFSSARPEVSITRWKQHTHVRFSDGTPVIVHRVDKHLLPEIMNVSELPVTSIRRTLIDLAGIGDSRTESVLDASLLREPAQLGQIWLLLEKEWMRGRRGIRILRDLLIPRTKGQAPTHSDLELMFKRIVGRFGLPRPVTQHPIDLPTGTIHVDFAYPDSMLAIELDSYAFHLDRKAFEEDRRRDNGLRALGWNVLRFTWAMLKFEPEYVVQVIRECLSSSQIA